MKITQGAVICQGRKAARGRVFGERAYEQQYFATANKLWLKRLRVLCERYSNFEIDSNDLMKQRGEKCVLYMLPCSH
jgi:hypothetical protein